MLTKRDEIKSLLRVAKRLSLAAWATQAALNNVTNNNLRMMWDLNWTCRCVRWNPGQNRRGDFGCVIAVQRPPCGFYQ